MRLDHLLSRETICKGPARALSILGIRPPGLPEHGTPRHLGNCIARDMFGGFQAPERSQLDINQCRNVDSASSKSVRIAEIRFTQNFIFTFSDDLHHRLAFTGGARPPRDRGKKIPRAHGGCLGMGSRRRARQAAISPGEAQTAFDPGIPEWGNPAGVMPCCPHPNPYGARRQPGELKHLSTPRKGNQPRLRE